MLSSVGEPELEQNKCFLVLYPLIYKIKGMVEDEILMLKCLQIYIQKKLIFQSEGVK
jgi:hypothetical protein